MHGDSDYNRSGNVCTVKKVVCVASKSCDSFIHTASFCSLNKEHFQSGGTHSWYFIGRGRSYSASITCMLQSCFT